MKMHDAREFRQADEPSDTHGAVADGFRLVRYFTVTSLIALTAVAFALYFLQRMEGIFFEQVQKEQSVFFAKVQSEFTRQQEDAARNNLLAVHEASHINLTRMFANVLWENDFVPFVTREQHLPIDHCRAIAASSEAGQPDARRACFAELGKKIMSFPEFTVLDGKVRTMMRNSAVFKIKVFDMRGITVYSSEHNQIGEDKANNRGWEIAADGKPASELTHRDRFSAFEGVVENRDLISSYIPGLAPDSEKIIGVFEIYSDVTPFLEQIKVASAKLAGIATANQVKVEVAAVENQRKVSSSSDTFLAIVGGLLMLLFVALYLIARNGQRILDLQAHAQERSIRREQRWYREKMTALATMAANVAHEIGNPLATITGLVEEIAEQQAKSGCSVCQPKALLMQTGRIANMTRQIADFAAARSETLEPVDVNQLVKAICDFMSFDQRFQATRIEFRPGDHMPARMVIPDHLNEALMNLLQMCAESGSELQAAPERILVKSESHDEDVLISIECGAVFTTAQEFTDSRFESARRRVVGMGGRLSCAEHTIELILPPVQPGA